MHAGSRPACMAVVRLLHVSGDPLCELPSTRALPCAGTLARAYANWYATKDKTKQVQWTGRLATSARASLVTRVGCPYCSRSR